MKKLVALLLTFLLVLTGCKSVEVTKVKDDIKTDSVRFHNEYTEVSEDNLFEYATYDNVIDTIKKDTGIIYFGFPSCDLCGKVTPILNDTAKEKSVKEILYYNFKDIRNNKTKEYNELVELLSDYLKEDDEGNKRLSAPTIVFVNKGNIVGVYIGSITSPEEIITEEEKNTLKETFLSLIDKMMAEEITTTDISEE